MKDRTGKTYGRLTVLRYAGIKSKQAAWTCRCDCGETVIVRGGDLTSGNTYSCGCYQRERTVATNKKENPVSKTPEYSSWKFMKQRCLNPNATNYSQYGGRGITIHEPWMSFENFLNDMGLKPNADDEIDRIDPNGNYEPNNCRWLARNKGQRRDSTLITHDGKTQSITDWAKELRIPRNTLDWRLKNGWTVSDALTS